MSIVEILLALSGIVAVIVSLITATGAVKRDAFAGLEKYVERLEKRLGMVEAQRDELDARVEKMEAERRDMLEKIRAYELQLDNLSQENSILAERNVELQKEIDTLRKSVNELKRVNAEKRK
jgi:chromosome segregation ATPase